MGDYGSLLGGIIHQLAVTPLGQGPTQSVPRPSRSEAIRLPARPHLSIDDGPVAGLINRPIFVHIIRPLLFLPSTTLPNVRPIQVASATIPPSDSARKHPSSSAQATRTTDTDHIRPLAHAPAAAEAAIGDPSAATALPAALIGTSTGGGSTSTQPTAAQEQYELTDYSHVRARQEFQEKEARRATKYTAKLAELEEAFEMK